MRTRASWVSSIWVESGPIAERNCERCSASWTRVVRWSTASSRSPWVRAKTPRFKEEDQQSRFFHISFALSRSATEACPRATWSSGEDLTNQKRAYLIWSSGRFKACSASAMEEGVLVTSPRISFMSLGKSQVLLTRAKADRRLLLEILSLAVQFAKQPKTRKGLFLTIDGIIFIQGSSSKNPSLRDGASRFV